jgi:hypothetical protein
MARKIIERQLTAGPHGLDGALTWALAVERVTRIELALSAWEADVLPLNYTRAVAPPNAPGPPTPDIVPDAAGATGATGDPRTR